MELDDLKNTWEDITNQVNKQQKLPTEKINQMTMNKYHTNLNKIAFPEIAGVIVCIIGAVFIAFNFSKLDNAFLQAVGIISILLLFLLSTISLISIRRLSKTADLTKPYADTIKDFAFQKIRFNKFQKANITLSYLLLVTTIILFSKFFGGKDITGSKYFWIFSFTSGYIFLLFYSKWVSKYYNNKLRQAENLLKELAS